METQPSLVNHTITVVIPLYNKAAHIRETLLAVLAQRHQHFHVIVIDDGSTDESYAQACSVQDARITLVQQTNQGVSAARNRGIHLASTAHIAFLDADDYWHPWHLEELNQLINRYPNLGLYSVAHGIRRHQQVLKPKQPFPEGFQGIVEEPFGAFATSLSLVHSSTACVSKKSAITIGGFPEGIRNGEDVYLWLRIALEHGIAYSTRFCAEYNQDALLGASRQNDADLPYYLHWLDQQLSECTLAAHYRVGAQRLLWSGLLYNAAGFRLKNNKKGIKQIKQLNISRTLKVRLLLLMIQIIPPILLRFARHFRHQQQR